MHTQMKMESVSEGKQRKQSVAGSLSKNRNPEKKHAKSEINLTRQFIRGFLK